MTIYIEGNIGGNVNQKHYIACYVLPESEEEIGQEKLFLLGVNPFGKSFDLAFDSIEDAVRIAQCLHRQLKDKGYGVQVLTCTEIGKKEER